MNLKSIFFRYCLMAVFGIFMNIFYIVFFPLTFYPVQFILSLFYNVSASAPIIIANGISISLIDACIAGSAYYLLLVLNLSTPEISIKKRIVSLLLGFSVFLIINIIRIVLLSVILINNYSFFDIIHKIVWYAFSVILAVFIWAVSLRIFRIKEMPFISDIKSVYRVQK